MNVIEIENLTKYYGDFKALDSLNLSVKEKDVLDFLGPNGSESQQPLTAFLDL
ncbi:MAG: hypothetical protein RMH75_04855 [Archaeoglobaceae archaeon]|nr:hypothetical protein [Archaeoglobaceae archaeon]MDW7989975.1 hypothetical protein [Archaeoglobaceae archaeon]